MCVRKFVSKMEISVCDQLRVLSRSVPTFKVDPPELQDPLLKSRIHKLQGHTKFSSLIFSNINFLSLKLSKITFIKTSL